LEIIIFLQPLNEELNDLYCLSDFIWVIKSGRMRWAGHVTPVGKEEVHGEFWCGNPSERDYLEDSGADGRTIIKGIFKKWIGNVNKIDLVHNRDRWRSVEPSGSIKNWEFLD
jgi:hypothetical protein